MADNGCTVGTVASGASAQVVVNVRIKDDQAGNQITNSAQVTSSVMDPNQANDSDDAVFEVDQAATDPMVDLVTEKRVVTARPALNKPVEYEITVSNNGPDTANDVVVTDTMNRDVVVLSTTASEGTCAREADVITCTGASLAVGETLIITVMVRPQRLGDLTNTASATATGSEQADSNNTAVVSAQIATAPAARYTFKKTASDRTLKRGQKVTFTLRVRVTGGSFQDLKVCDRLPRGFAYLKFRGGKLRNGRVCFTRKLARVGTHTFRITARVGARAKARVTNTATADVAQRAAKRSSVRLAVRGANARAGGVTG